MDSHREHMQWIENLSKGHTYVHNRMFSHIEKYPHKQVKGVGSSRDVVILLSTSPHLPGTFHFMLSYKRTSLEVGQ